MNRLIIFTLFLISCQITSSDYEYIIKNQNYRTEVLKNAKGEYVELSDGFTYFEEANKESNQGNVVLVHGYSIPSYIMETTFNSLKDRGYRVLMMDLYGRGYSDNPDLPQTDYLRANQVIELMEYTGVNNAALVGLSNGGRIISKIADLDPERGHLAEEQFNCSWFKNYEDLLPKVEAVCIAVPTLLHHKVGTTCLNQGKHVLIEKPIAASKQEASELIEASNKSKCILQLENYEGTDIVTLSREFDKGS